MKTKTRSILFALVALALVASGFWYWRNTGVIQTAVATSLPEIPDLSNAPVALREQVSAAETQAHSRFGAHAGLAQLSRIYHANGFLREAIQCYEGLEQLDPSEPRWLHLHASIIAGYGEVEPALALWKRVVTLAPNFFPAQLRLGDSQLKSNRAADAAATYNTVLQRDPTNSYAQLGLARLDFEAERWPEAQKRLESVVQQTNYVLGYDLIVTLYERTGQPERALAIRGSQKASGNFRDPPDPWLDDLMDVCFDPYRLALTAGFIARNGDPAKGVQLLERAIELAPNDVSSRFQLGTLSVVQKNFTVAREQLERCTRLAPDFADGWAHLSGLQSQLGDNSAALRTLEAGLAKCPQSPGLHLMRAQTLKKAGAVNESIAEYRESIRLRPNEADAYIELANFLIGLDQIDEALRLLQQSLEAEPANPAALSTLTFHAISTGDESNAQRWFSKIRQQPRVPSEQVSKLRAAYQEQFGRALR